jgi:hypothetical protein
MKLKSKINFKFCNKLKKKANHAKKTETKKNTVGRGKPITLQNILTGKPIDIIVSTSGMIIRGGRGVFFKSPGSTKLSSIFGVLITTPSAEV